MLCVCGLMLALSERQSSYLYHGVLSASGCQYFWDKDPAAGPGHGLLAE